MEPQHLQPHGVGFLTLQHVVNTLKPHHAILAIVVALVCISLVRRTGKNPPGPYGLPILGNLHQTPFKDIWKTYAAWHRKYGPIISFKYGQRTFMSVGSFEVAKDLLDKRSSRYSSRPQLTVVNYMQRALATAIVPYGPRLQTHLELLASILNPRTCRQYEYLQDIESKQVLHEILLSEGKGLRKILHRYSTGVVFTLAYGQRLSHIEDERIHQVETLSSFITANIQKPSSLIVEAFPALDYLPRALAPWKRMGDRVFADCSELFGNFLNQGLNTKAWNWSKALHKLNQERFSLSMVEISFVLGTLLEASSTVDKVLEFFIHAAILHPAEVTQAQQELDRVVGPHRLPNFSDMADLPYVDAFIEEVIRWRPITPLGLPHAPTEDDEYKGYDIPRGTAIIANNWALARDPKYFKDAERFRPSRWIECRTLPTAAFGFGQRRCPGRYLGRKSLSVLISRIIWGYNISHAVDTQGVKIPMEPDRMLQNSVSGPVDVQAQLTVRSAVHKVVVQKEFAELETDTDLILQRIFC